MAQNTKQSDIKLVRSGCSHLFCDVRTSIPYIDKSLLIKDLFDPVQGIFGLPDDEHKQEIVLITAPSSFGKSVNMDMIECGIGIQVDVDTGDHIPRESHNSNYQLFQGLKIMDDLTFVEKIFGKRPVIKVKFFCPSSETVSSLKCAQDFCRTVVHRTYLRHRYLKNSPNLNDEEKQLCVQWCSIFAYKKNTHEDTLKALVSLSEFLHKHHGRKVFILVDEYDSLAMKAMLNAPENILFKIARLPVDIVAATMRYNMEHVAGGILTGISYIVGMGLSADLKIKHVFKFLQMGKLNKYYGFTETEIGQILDDFGWSEVEKKDVQNTYNNYLAQGEQISLYNMWSVMMHVKQVQMYKYQMQNNLQLSNLTSPMRPKGYWMNSTGIAGIQNAFQHPYLKSILNKLVWGETISASICPIIKEEHLKMLRALVMDAFYTREQRKQPRLARQVTPTSDLFVTFLLEQGCLTYASHNESGESGLQCLRIPNREVRQKLAADLKEYYISLEGFDGMDLNSCTISLLEAIHTNVDSMFQQKLNTFKDTLEKCCIPIKQSLTVANYLVFKEFLFHPLFATGYDLQTELPNSDGNKGGFLLYKNGFAVIIELKYNGEDEGLEQIFVKEYYKLFTDPAFCGQGVQDYILIGLDFTPEFKVSMCFLRKRDVDRHAVSLTSGQVVPKMKIRELVKYAQTV